MPDDIVLIPSQLCTGATFSPQVPVLETIGRTMVLVQHGHETIAAMADGVLAAAAPRFTLIAHGMGGFVAFEILRRAPARVSRLALISTLAPADTPKQTARREGYLKLVAEGKYDGIIDERIPMLLHPSRTADAGLVATMRNMAAETGPENFLLQQRAIMARLDSVSTLPTIACPTLLIFGRQDGITTLEHQEQMASLIPNARLEIVEDSGHMVTLEKPDVVNGLLRAFLD